MSKKGMDHGGQTGMSIRQHLQGIVIQLPKDERADFYTGLFSALAGSAAADLGSPAATKLFEELLEFMKNTPKQTLDEVATDRGASNE